MSGIEGPKNQPKPIEWTPPPADLTTPGAKTPEAPPPKAAAPPKAPDSIDLAAAVDYVKDRMKELLDGKLPISPAKSEASKVVGESGPNAIRISSKTTGGASASDFGAQLRSQRLSETPIYQAIGRAEGTIGADGKPTAAYRGHGDPGNGKLNRGFGSYQVYQDPRGAALSPEQADRIQADRLGKQWPSVKSALDKAGFAPGPTRDLVAANALDAWNQAPLTHEGRNGLLNPGRLAELKANIDSGKKPLDAVVNWRSNGYKNDSGVLDAPGLGNTMSGVRDDQHRRTVAVAAGLASHPVSHSASETASQKTSAATPPSTPPSNQARHTATARAAGHEAKIHQGDQGPHVRELKIALQEAGFYQGVINDVMGKDGIDALMAAKKELKLGGPVDVAGNFTLQKVREFAKQGGLAGAIDANDPTLQKLASGHIQGYGGSSCVESVFKHCDSVGVRTFEGGTAEGHNNPREAMVRTLQAGHWVSVPLPGIPARKVTINDDIAGKAEAYVMSPKDYEKLASQGKVPNGALVFQTEKGWDWNGSAYGNDVAIVRNGGRNPFNFVSNSTPLIYHGATKEVVLLVPKSSVGR